jgi:hypothetical protein
MMLDEAEKVVIIGYIRKAYGMFNCETRRRCEGFKMGLKDIGCEGGKMFRMVSSGGLWYYPSGKV